MKRNKFIVSMLAASVATISVNAKSELKNLRTDKGFKVKAGEGRIHGHIKLKGVNSNVLDVKISGKDTDGEGLPYLNKLPYRKGEAHHCIRTIIKMKLFL